MSGDFPLELQVTDVLALKSIEVYINSRAVGFISSGKPTLTIPSYLAPNGANTIYIRAINAGIPVETGDIMRLESWASTTVQFENEMTLNNSHSEYSARGNLNLEYQGNTESSFTFRVRDLADNVLFTQTGQSAANGLFGYRVLDYQASDHPHN